MEKLTENLRRIAESEIEAGHLRDQWVFGYEPASQMFWAVGVDAQGMIDHEFSERMPPAYYQLMGAAIEARVRRRTGAVAGNQTAH
ncbi:hypothetical protein ACS8YF_00335 [Salinisphaera sp. SWV1]|uniref:hypothetical protein n=1 Tax=Salinisphaera sp. SWV1 TaxID=3454139 RepID=UPI003F831DFB